MNRITLIIVITVIFIAVGSFFEFIHQQVDAEVAQVPPEYLKPYDVNLTTDFIENLKSRESKVLGQDLGF